MASPTQMDLSLSTLWETVEDRGALHAAVPGVAKSQTWLQRLNNNNNIYVLVYDTCFSLSDLLHSK